MALTPYQLRVMIAALKRALAELEDALSDMEEEG